eukprot:TRINITY_DN425_c1_g1_i1.p1 TRINITY_DN425_c1_g1~~TRINITY_DN425_c1_g1_i1.p1  ORF type:complete len:141 (+),score=0.73 TRINITY_DN425_c1_g1_i1:91-513(+)
MIVWYLKVHWRIQGMRGGDILGKGVNNYNQEGRETLLQQFKTSFLLVFLKILSLILLVLYLFGKNTKKIQLRQDNMYPWSINFPLGPPLNPPLYYLYVSITLAVDSTKIEQHIVSIITLQTIYFCVACLFNKYSKTQQAS